MKSYETPYSSVDWLELEESFLTGASADGFTVVHSNPFGSSTNGLMEEDDYE